MSDRSDLLLRNARLVTANGGQDADIAVLRGRIRWIGEPGTDRYGASVELDLDGGTLLPGLIDSHVHFREPGRHSHKGTYASEGLAAAAGGVTTVLTMPNTDPYTGSRDVLARARICARRRTAVDYGFHFGVLADNQAELGAVRNVASYKLYLNETTGVATPLGDEALLARVLRLGHPVTAHAEGETLDHLLDVHRRHGAGPLYVVHLSLAREVEALRAAKARGQWVYGEVTPHHLFLDDTDLARLGPFADMRPTLKSAADVEALWSGLADGTIDTIATDHAPHLREEKEGASPPPGVPGLQTMLPLLLTAVHEGRAELRDIVHWTAVQPARIFALRDKGEVRIGVDADFVLVDPAAEHEIRDEEQLTYPRWTPFAGRLCRGRVVMTILRGQVIFRDGEVLINDSGREVMTRDPGQWQSLV